MTSEPSSGTPPPEESRSDRGDSAPAERALPAAQQEEGLPAEDFNEIVERLERAPATQREAIFAYFHSGPLPPPHQLDQYNRIIDRGAERIFEMALAEQAHRRQLQNRELEMARAQQDHEVVLEREAQSHRIQIDREQSAFDRRFATRGQVAGVVIIAACVAGAIWLAYKDANPISVAALLGLPIATIISVLITGRRRGETAGPPDGEPPAPKG